MDQKNAVNTSLFFEQTTAEAAEERRQQRMLNLFTWLLAPYLLAYGAYRLSQGDIGLGLLEIGLGVIEVVNWFLYKWHKRIALAKPAITICSGVLLLVILESGGINGTGIYWSLVFPSTTYLFQGVRLGNWYNAAFFVSHVAYALAVRQGAVASYYEYDQLRQVWSSLLLLNLLGYVAESGWDKARRVVVEQRERLRVLLENLPVGAIMVNAQGETLAVNGAAIRIAGREPESMLNIAKYTARFHVSKENGSPYPPEELPTSMALKSGETVTKSDIFVNRPDGGRIVLRVVAAPVRGADGSVNGAVSVYEDMTKEHEIDQMKTEFVSLASHQLKTPLTSIKWTVEALLGGDFGKISAEQHQPVSQVESIADRLLRLVGDLLSVSRIETGKKFNLVRKPTDVVPVLASILTDFVPAATQKKVVLASPTLPASLMLDVDTDKFREVFSNLIGNAVKYSRDGGKVEVGLETVDGVLQLFVKDAGMGIPKDEQPKMFSKFFRASNAAEGVEGTGLGLYIVKSIVEKHDGRVWFDSEEGKGTTFHVVLPTVKSA